MTEKGISRRDLLKGAAAAAVFSIVPRHVLGGPGHTPPSEKLRKAVIGTGGMGRGHIGMPGAELLAICDADSKHLQLGLERARENGHQPKLYRDFREILARPDIDVVHIATPPHWHAIMAVMAAQAGKDIWCEKPMARTIVEGQKVIEAVRHGGRIFRINTGSRFGGTWYDSGMTVHAIKKAVDARLVGWPVKVTIGKKTGFDWKLDQWSGSPELKAEAVPEELDYEMWLGPAPYKPYNKERVHMKFRGYWDYDGGGLGDMGQHYMDPVQYVLGKDETSPVEIVADAPQQHSDAAGEWRTVTLRYADGCEIVLDAGEPVEGVETPLVEGPKGKIFKNYKSTVANLEKKIASLPALEPQETDFYDCIKTRRKFCLNEENGHRSCTLINLAKAAIRTGRTLKFDPDKQIFIDDDEANRLVHEPMRAPWHL